MVTKRIEIVEAAKGLETAVQNWDKDSTIALFWRGVTVKPVSESVNAAALELFEACKVEDVEPDGRELVFAVDRFEDKYKKWAQQCGMPGSTASPGGSVDMWNAYRDLLQRVPAPVRRLPEPIAQLITQEVAPRQIAKIYGWYLDDGTPDVTKVQQESDKPGTHYNPKTWVSRHEVAKRSEADKQWAERTARVAAADVRAKPNFREAPETLEELIGQRVSAEQIAKMKRMDIEEVRKRAAQIGIALDAETARHVDPNEHKREAEQQRDKKQQEELDIAKLNSHPELPTLEQRVAACIQDGNSHTVTAKMLQREFPGLTYQRVGRIANEHLAIANA